jgi:hypothetical protein
MAICNLNGLELQFVCGDLVMVSRICWMLNERRLSSIKVETGLCRCAALFRSITAGFAVFRVPNYSLQSKIYDQYFLNII